MEGYERIWSSYQGDLSSHQTSSFTNSLTNPSDTSLSSFTTWQGHMGFLPPPTYTTVIPMYGHVPPNVNPFISQNHVSNLLSDPDAEVCYYSKMSEFEPDPLHFDENRCSSTDTIVSTSSVSTVLSHSSLDTESEPNDRQGLKRKRQTVQKTKNGKTKKVKKSDTTYKRWPKPPYSYCGMIITVIQLSPNKELTLQGIHAGLMELFPFFRGSYLGWRDSVRHNLSHNSCFIKVEQKPSTRSCLWKVDWARVSPTVFARQQTKNGTADTYKPTIHEHLGLPPFVNETFLKEDNGSTVYVPQTPSHQKIEIGGDRTPQVCDTKRFNVALPCIDKCENLGDSPIQVGRQDHLQNHVSFELISPLKVSDSPKVSKTAPSSETFSGVSNLGHVFDLVVSEKRSSMDAVQHLHSLCIPMTTAPSSQTQTHLSSPFRGSHASPMFLSVAPLVVQVPDNQTDQVQDGRHCATDSSISSLISTDPKCETYMTSLIAGETDTDSAAELPITESGYERSNNVALSSVDNNEDIEIIDI